MMYVLYRYGYGYSEVPRFKGARQFLSPVALSGLCVPDARPQLLDWAVNGRRKKDHRARPMECVKGVGTLILQEGRDERAGVPGP